jgi:hypothetical protein
MEKIRQDTSPNALRGIEICESRAWLKNQKIAINKNNLSEEQKNKLKALGLNL